MYSPSTRTSISSSIVPTLSLSSLTLACTIMVTTSPASALEEMVTLTLDELGVVISSKASRVPVPSVNDQP